LQDYPRALRRFRRHSALTAAVSAFAAAGLTISTIKPALAEFEIQESTVEKGETEVEYRGAVHWGLPKQEKEEAAEGDDDEAAGVAEEGEEGPLRQSHDLELEYGITDRWLITATLTAAQPLDESFALSAVEFELQYELIEIKDNKGIGLAFLGGYGFATRGGEADEIEFGPVVEFGTGKLLLTFNPFFSAQVGDNATTDSLGFDYGWRAEYDFAKHWGVGVEMFGEIEDLANAGSFDDQTHSIGPTLLWNPSGDDEGEEKEGKGGDDDRVAGPPEMELSLNIGIQFGLTDATSDTALKFQGTLSF
jgi:hypothetical protein